ncbi:hypothetical protein [Candidatus Lariskella endosymbiont of Hedychridium roseum]|uniref:hypothetical protein n=1 Tax=Candidatus Lariskella endosymbiont of Hedychridium roseum TaxID=3077949 RepID=UPI0030CC608F
MKKFLIVIAVFFLYLYAKEWLDTRPIQFERYKDSDQFDADLQKKFPLGSDMREMMKLFEQSGAKCEDRSGEEQLKEEVEKYGLVYWCKYSSDWLSFDPLGGYIMWVMGDKHYKLLHVGGTKTPKLVT